MGRDKARDDKYLNCSQEHELRYVASLYLEYAALVLDFLHEVCRNGRIRYLTHTEVYQLIKEELGLPVPV